MWLSKDERRLLAGYYRNGLTPGRERVYWVTEVMKLLSNPATSLVEYGDRPDGQSGGQQSVEDQKRKNEAIIDGNRRVTRANEHLQERGLISWRRHQAQNGVILITLQIHGCDLGMRYASWFGRSGLWFDDYRNHWIWLIVSFFGGAIAALLVQWLNWFAGPPQP